MSTVNPAGRYRTGNHNARNIYRVDTDGAERHVGCMFTEADGREVVAALNEVEELRAVVERARDMADKPSIAEQARAMGITPHDPSEAFG